MAAEKLSLPSSPSFCLSLCDNQFCFMDKIYVGSLKAESGCCVSEPSNGQTATNISPKIEKQNKASGNVDKFNDWYHWYQHNIVLISDARVFDL